MKEEGGNGVATCNDHDRPPEKVVHLGMELFRELPYN